MTGRAVHRVVSGGVCVGLVSTGCGGGSKAASVASLGTTNVANRSTSTTGSPVSTHVPAGGGVLRAAIVAHTTQCHPDPTFRGLRGVAFIDFSSPVPVAVIGPSDHRRRAPDMAAQSTNHSHDRRYRRAGPAGGGIASAQENGAVAFAHCMRSHRVPNWPDPNHSGVFARSKLTPQQLGASGSHVQAAQRACQHLLPNRGSGPTPAQLQLVRAQALRFSQCMRAHGVPSFPDPDSTGRIADPASFGIDQGSPKFQAANQACRKYRPPYIPSNAAYNRYVRTQGS